MVREISRAELGALESHFLTLDSDDRRLRFGVPVGDTAVRAYVARIDFDHAMKTRLAGAAGIAAAWSQKKAA